MYQAQGVNSETQRGTDNKIAQGMKVSEAEKGDAEVRGKKKEWFCLEASEEKLNEGMAHGGNRFEGAGREG